MQRSRWAILWAVVMILGGAVLLAQNLGLVPENFEASIWTIILGGVGLLFLLDAITSKGEDWWALIPGCIMLGVAATIWLSESGVKGEYAGSVMLFSIALAFLLVYLVKRGEFWWALIPGGVMAAVAVIPILTLNVPGEVIGTFVLWAIGIPFIVVYLINRKNWWALIPGGVLLAVGVIPLLTLSTRGELAGTFVLWVIAAPFIVVYLAKRQNWWALIPGGALFVIGCMPLLASVEAPDQIIAGVFFIGLAAVFGLLYLVNRGKPDMFWPVYPAAALLVIGVGVMALGQNWWPVALIALGVIMLIRTLFPGRK